MKNKGIMNYQMKNLQIKKKVFDLFCELIKQKPEYLFGMGRIKSEIIPVIMIQFGISSYDPSNDKIERKSIFDGMNIEKLKHEIK